MKDKYEEEALQYLPIMPEGYGQPSAWKGVLSFVMTHPLCHDNPDIYLSRLIEHGFDFQRSRMVAASVILKKTPWYAVPSVACDIASMTKLDDGETWGSIMRGRKVIAFCYPEEVYSDGLCISGVVSVNLIQSYGYVLLLTWGRQPSGDLFFSQYPCKSSDTISHTESLASNKVEGGYFRHIAGLIKLADNEGLVEPMDTPQRKPLTHTKRNQKRIKPKARWLCRGIPDNDKKDHQGGTHASPREHWRKGHYRTMKSGLKVWINAMLIGKKKDES